MVPSVPSGTAEGNYSDPAAGVRAGSAQPETVDRCLETRPTRDRALEEELLESQLPVEDVALGEAELLLGKQRQDRALLPHHSAYEGVYADEQGELGEVFLEAQLNRRSFGQALVSGCDARILSLIYLEELKRRVGK